MIFRVSRSNRLKDEEDEEETIFVKVGVREIERGGDVGLVWSW